MRIKTPISAYKRRFYTIHLLRTPHVDTWPVRFFGVEKAPYRPWDHFGGLLWEPYKRFTPRRRRPSQRQYAYN